MHVCVWCVHRHVGGVQMCMSACTCVLCMRACVCVQVTLQCVATVCLCVCTHVYVCVYMYELFYSQHRTESPEGTVHESLTCRSPWKWGERRRRLSPPLASILRDLISFEHHDLTLLCLGCGPRRLAVRWGRWCPAAGQELGQGRGAWGFQEPSSAHLRRAGGPRVSCLWETQD